MVAKDEQDKEQAVSKLLTPEGKPIRVLSTSLGIALLANALLSPSVIGASNSTSVEDPQLVSWSTEEVKAYFDSNVDWNIPYPDENTEEVEQKDEGVVTSNGTTVVNNYGGYNSGFGWDDMLLYHMLFNSGSNYSSRGWNNNRQTYYGGTRNTYNPPNYSSDKFQNKNVAGSVVKPRTSTSSTGSITRRSTSTQAGGIGGKSSGLSSSSSSSSSVSKSSTSSTGKSGFGG